MRIVWDEHERLGKWVCDRTGGRYANGQCIGMERDDGTLIAATLYDNYNGAAINMHVAATTPHWMRPYFLKVCFGYPFLQLECDVVIGWVAAENIRARRVDEWLGFKLACTVPKAHPSGDMLLYTMHREHCRWLEGQDDWW